MIKAKNILKRVPGILVGILSLIIIFAIINPLFLSGQNIINILNNAAALLIVSCGMTMAILSGQLDMSVGGVTTFSAMIVGVYMSRFEAPSALQILTGVIIGILIGAVFGIFNGIMIGHFKYNYWLVTFSTMSIGYGLAQVVTGGNIISGYGKSFRSISTKQVLGMPALIWISIIVLVVFLLITYKTRFGMHLYAVGDSEQCARQSGINVGKIRFAIFTLSGCLAGFAGSLLVAKTNSASPIIGNGYEFDAIAAVIIGGTPFAGGKGGLLGTLIGAISLYAIKTGLQIIGFNVYVQQVFIGVFILAIIVVDVIGEKRKRKKEGRRVYK